MDSSGRHGCLKTDKQEFLNDDGVEVGVSTEAMRCKLRNGFHRRSSRPRRFTIFSYWACRDSRQPTRRTGSWRISLETADHERKGFTDLAELLGFSNTWLEHGGQMTTQNND